MSLTFHFISSPILFSSFCSWRPRRSRVAHWQRHVPEAHPLPRQRHVWHHGQSLLPLFCQTGGGPAAHHRAEDKPRPGQRVRGESQEEDHHTQSVEQTAIMSVSAAIYLVVVFVNKCLKRHCFVYSTVNLVFFAERYDPYSPPKVNVCDFEMRDIQKNSPDISP